MVLGCNDQRYTWTGAGPARAATIHKARKEFGREILGHFLVAFVRKRGSFPWELSCLPILRVRVRNRYSRETIFEWCELRNCFASSSSRSHLKGLTLEHKQCKSTSRYLSCPYLLAKAANRSRSSTSDQKMEPVTQEHDQRGEPIPRVERSGRSTV